MRPLLICFIIFSMSCFAQEGSDPQKLINEILAPSGTNFDLSKITPKNKDAVTNELRHIVKTKDGDYVGSRILLLQIGDSQTIEEMMTEFSAYKTRAAWTGFRFYVERARQPLLVEAFTEELYAPLDQGMQGMQGNPKNGIVMQVYPKPVMAAASILWTIESSKEFSLELKRWAYEIDRGYPFSKQPLLLQKWWEQNKEKLQAHRFGEVEPLHEPAPAATPIPDSKEKSTPAVSSMISDQIQTPTLQTPSPSPVASTQVSGLTSPWLFWLGSVVMLLALGACLWRLLSKR